MRINKNDKRYILFITICSLFILLFFFLENNSNYVIDERYISVTKGEWSHFNIDTSAEYSIDGTISKNLSEYYPFIQGSGTMADPYVLANIELNSSDVAHNIYIKNVNDYFHITNLTLHITEPGGSNIEIVNCSNIMIYNNILSANIFGINMIGCKNASIYNNTIINKPYNGLSLFACQKITISNNIISSKYNGIHLGSDIDVLIKKNDFINNEGVAINTWGLWSLQILSNNFSNNENGIFLRETEESSIKENFFNNNKKLAIKLSSSHYNNLSSNFISNSQYGVEISAKSENNMLYNNTMTDISIKPIKFWVRNNAMIDNTLKQSFWGVFLIYIWCLGATTLVTYPPYYIIKRRRNIKQMIESYKSSVDQKDQLNALETELKEFKLKYFELSKKINHSNN